MQYAEHDPLRLFEHHSKPACVPTNEIQPRLAASGNEDARAAAVEPGTVFVQPGSFEVPVVGVVQLRHHQELRVTPECQLGSLLGARKLGYDAELDAAFGQRVPEHARLSPPLLGQPDGDCRVAVDESESAVLALGVSGQHRHSHQKIRLLYEIVRCMPIAS